MKLKASFKWIISLLWGRLHSEWVSEETLEKEPKMQRTFPLTSFQFYMCCIYRLWAREFGEVVSVTLLNNIEDVFWIFIHGLHLGQKKPTSLFHGKLHSSSSVHIFVHWATGGFITFICFQIASIFEKRMSFLGWRKGLLLSKNASWLAQWVPVCIQDWRIVLGKIAYIFKGSFK